MVEKRPTKTSWARAVENMLAVILIFAGIAAAGGLIAALAGGFEGWAIVAGISVIVLFGAGFLAIRDGARRRALETNTVVYAPDNTDQLFDVDPNTGERTPHRE
ncbi:hypothetical protein O4160_19010 [Rhodococcus sp. IEGM 1401]|uniref:hypothetical protein n=1 Tax=unclassified Rhodococcus (in: high G+C Gram-positive bacteria) TaxID=192944 RepID=UPI0022B5364F|nr:MULTISPECIES: hypothetical protein [unclassified Rhodococcus (in: high G+C Gram-positive bacteria)]MCZ4562933.1 hypothetical protein [Rhodococcus sp. IEGM 1401]MDI6627864.1 hypothetical protein [Rhodococcus sp. (in: high G+C Gram-positive bacteria)]MDI9923036.1 hypothetical protein [Rhodococcus sp. IEGM 1372]MDV8035603.1 hypothetical protein [Rhodococcus sp. IEGM 1414]